MQACEDYLSGRKSASQIAQELSMPESGDSIIRKWAHQYEKLGAEIFLPKKHNKKYSKEFKHQVVQEYLKGEGSCEELTNRHGISGHDTVRQWVMKYTKGEEIKDYDPYPEVYMANPRKTTYEERLEIVRYCIDNNKNYKKTADEYKQHTIKVPLFLCVVFKSIIEKEAFFIKPLTHMFLYPVVPNPRFFNLYP